VVGFEIKPGFSLSTARYTHIAMQI